MIVTLVSHDVRGITSRDLNLARQISSHAAELGIHSDASSLTHLDLGLDTALGLQLAPFDTASLGGKVENGEPVDPRGQVPTVWWQEPDGDETWAQPKQPFEQRWHFDVWEAHDKAERRLQQPWTPTATAPASAHQPAGEPHNESGPPPGPVSVSHPRASQWP